MFFVPLNLLIAAGSILAFISDPDSGIVTDNSFINVNILVGCIGALSVFWSSVDRLLNFKSRTDMHEAAKQLCKDLLLDLDFRLVRYQSLSEEERLGSKKPWEDEDLSEIKAKLDHVQLSCTSSIPDAISEAFKRLNTLVSYDLEITGLDKADRDDVQKLRIANVLLCKEITKSWFWPMFLPGKAVTESAQCGLKGEIESRKKKEKAEKAEQAVNEAQAATLAASAVHAAVAASAEPAALAAAVIAAVAASAEPAALAAAVIAAVTAAVPAPAL